MACISSAWERIAVGKTGSTISQKEEKVAMNVSISSFYLCHSPANERWSMFKTGASTEAGWIEGVCAQRPHMELSEENCIPSFFQGTKSAWTTDSLAAFSSVVGLCNIKR